MMVQGYDACMKGDVKMARQFFDKAAEMGA